MFTNKIGKHKKFHGREFGGFRFSGMLNKDVEVPFDECNVGIHDTANLGFEFVCNFGARNLEKFLNICVRLAELGGRVKGDVQTLRHDVEGARTT